MSYESDAVTAKLNELVISLDLHFALPDFADLNPVEQALAGT